MSEFEYAETIAEYDREGWHIKVQRVPDWDYRPGVDDDIYVTPEPYQPYGGDMFPYQDQMECPKCDGRGEVPDRRYTDGWRECADCEGSGYVEDPDGFKVDYRDGTYYVTGQEVRRVIEIGWGENPPPETRAKARETLKDDARAIGHEDLTWCGVVVTASRGAITGTDSLWGIEYDLRQPASERYAENGDCVSDHGMVENAIDEAARKVAGDLAPLALSY